MKKKLILTPPRRKQLARPDSHYVIRWVPNHPDDRGKQECQAGFFSLFIRALYGIRLADVYDVPYHVDYGHIPYGYSDPQKFEGDTNFWNYYFVQPTPTLLPSESPVINRPFETFPLRIWNASFYRQMHRIVDTHIQLQPKVRQLIEERKTAFQDKRVLGVHIRRTDHTDEVEPVAWMMYQRTIHRALRHFDRVFIATDDLETLNKMIATFGKRVLYNEVKRSVDGTPLHCFHPIEGRYELGLDALLDCYCLSLCHRAILCHSNLSYTALLLNPNLPYTLLETPKHRNLRLKTLLSYHLDRLTTPLP